MIMFGTMIAYGLCVTLLYSLIACWWVGLKTLWWFWLKDLSIDEMVGAWCFGCLSGPPGFTCWISFAPVFSFIYCWVLIFALSPCYISVFWLKDLSIDEMVGAWCFGCLSGPPGFTCWISFAPVFSFIYCWVLIFALSPCYISIYMF